MSNAPRFRLVRVRNGASSVFSEDFAEAMHPGLGPAEESRQLYVEQLELPARLRIGEGQFVIWDIGLGAGANALAAISAAREAHRQIFVLSFDQSTAALEFAVECHGELSYLALWKDKVQTLVRDGQVDLPNGKWRLCLGDFTRLAGSEQAQSWPKPDAILFDPHSPQRNPAMWTFPLLRVLFNLLEPSRPCSLASYSRSTIFRVTLLLAGFYVGAGAAIGLKEETTVAANDLSLIRKPLGRQWLERARRSGSAEPLLEPIYQQRPVSDSTWEKLVQHPQFR